MKSITIRNVPAETHRSLRIRAARNGRSLEAELRAVLGAIAGVNSARERMGASKPRTARPLDLTHGDVAIDAAQARKKIQQILRHEGE